MLEAYRAHVQERAELNIPAKPLTAGQVAELVELLKNPPEGEAEFLLELLSTRVPPGVDVAAYVKAGFLSAVAKGETQCDLISPADAVALLGNMHGGYNIETLVTLLTEPELAETMPQIIEISVVLPAPLGPSSARISPSWISRSTLLKAWWPLS